MKKLIYSLLALISLIILIYSILWFWIFNSLANTLTKEHAGRSINGQVIGMEQYSFGFSKISAYGFPFKFAIKIINWYEENSVSKIEFKSPIYLGYDLFKQSFFLSYSGNAIGWHKPLQGGFGANFYSDYYQISIKMPLSFELFKIFINKKPPFEIINFIKKIELRSDKTQIFDLIDKQKLYDEDHSYCALSLDTTEYYTDIDDFINNPPKKINITYSTKILDSQLQYKLIPSGLLLYRFAWPIAVAINSKFYIKTNSTTLYDWFKDFEIHASYLKTSNNFHNLESNFLYKIRNNSINNKAIATNNNIIFKLDGQIDLKPGFSDQLFNALSYLAMFIPQMPQTYNYINDIKYIIDNKDKFNLAEFEKRQYRLSYDMEVQHTLNEALVKINDFSIFSEDTGIRLNNTSTKQLFQKLDSKGLLALNNYPKIIDIIAKYFGHLGRFKTFSDETKEIYVAAIKSFLKNISDHPNSTSNNISLECEIDFSDIDKAKIGSLGDINKLWPLFYIELYKQALTKIQPGDNSLIRLQQLIPDFNNHQKLFQELMIQPLEQ